MFICKSDRMQILETRVIPFHETYNSLFYIYHHEDVVVIVWMEYEQQLVSMNGLFASL